jgi:hypothetical protein
VLGPRVDQSDQPSRVTAELYRAHAIENYDTAAIRCQTAGGVEILFVVSHATAGRHGPMFSFEFENAVVEFADGQSAAIAARFTDGSTKPYGSPNDQRYEKLWSAIRSARDGTPTACGIEAALAHTRCAWAAQQSMKEIKAFPQAITRVEGAVGSRKTWVEGLDDALQRCYEQFKTPAQLGVSWAASGSEIIVDETDHQLDEITA